jgi:hypothetical protein
VSVAAALPPAQVGAPQVAVTNEASLALFRGLAASAPNGALSFAQIDPARAGVTLRAEGAAAFVADLAALGALGFLLVERNGKSLAVLRSREAAPESDRAFLVLDSHCSVAGLASLARAREYVVEEGGQPAPELTWVVGKCAE